MKPRDKAKNKWKLITTAPKTGESILAAQGKRQMVVWWLPAEKVSLEAWKRSPFITGNGGCWVYDITYYNGQIYSYNISYPTHWMPLQPSPEEGY